MAKINILKSSVYNKIAAGEVVERPASIVKELVENSIDAGADKIEISIENGGMSGIIVSDNGCGIDRESVETAFLNHATSKVSQESDLESIHTLGFRGEALASIAAVTKLEITTRTAEENFGTKLRLVGGEVEQKTDVGASVGTSIKITDLFFNTPARKKFLKKPSGETSEITNLIQRLILANPNIAIKYIANGNTVYNSQGTGIESAIYAVYDKETLSNCEKIDWFYKDIEVSGYVGNCYFTKPNRTYQTVIVNGRYVVNNTVCSAVQRAFERYLTTRTYPFFVLNIKIPFQKVDVNVHPNKMEVKFEDPQSVFYAVYIPVKEMLNAFMGPSVPSVTKNSVQLEITKQVQSVPQATHTNDTTSGITLPPPNEADKQLFSQLTKPQQPPQVFERRGLAAPEPSLSFDDYDTTQSSDENQKIYFAESIKIGVAFNTYIILQKGESLYFIDQHAAHEMLLYDRFINDYQRQKNIKQQLLVPFAFTVKQDEALFLSENIDKINDCGFVMEEFGENSFKITEVPLIFADADFDKLTKSFIADLDNIKPDVNYIKDKLARAACRAAIKGGDKLSEDDINVLKANLDKSTVLRCPHGRPVVVRVSKYEIEKWFKRIL